MDQRQQQIKKSFTDKAVHTPKHSNTLINFICSKQLFLICGKEDAYASGNRQFHALGYNTALAFVNHKRLGCFSSAKIIASLSPRSNPVARCNRETLSAERSEWTSKNGQFLKYSASSGYSVLRVNSSNTAKGMCTELYSLFKTSIRPILNRVNNGVVSEITIT